MFTVKTIDHGTFAEHVFQARQVFRYKKNHDSKTKSADDFFGVIIDRVDTPTMRIPESASDTKKLEDRTTIYVMNEHGKTVATYEL